MENKIKLLQISDIHWQKTIKVADDYHRIQQLMLQDMRYYCAHNKERFDRILICGDIAFSGQKEEYDKAEIFLNELCGIIGCKSTDINMIPGNHDKNVDENYRNTRELLHVALDKHEKGDNMLEGILTNEFETFKMLTKPFEEYAKFSYEKYDSGETLMYNSTQVEHIKYEEYIDMMYWVSPFDTKLSGYEVLLYGFNTALTSDLDDFDIENENRKDGHRMFLPRITYRSIDPTDGKINIMMAHHPMVFVHNGDEIQKELDKYCKLQLYGHVHISNTKVTDDAIHIYSGSFEPGSYDIDKYRPTYNIIEITIVENDKKEDVLHVDLQVHYWDGSKFLQDEASSVPLEVKLPSKKDRFAIVPTVIEPQLPDGITQREVRSLFKQCAHYQEIVDNMYPGVFGVDAVRYRLNQSFLEKVRIDNRWQELYNRIKNYERNL